VTGGSGFAGAGLRVVGAGFPLRGIAAVDAELRAVQPSVKAAFGHELVVAPDLDDAALIEHADQVRLLHG